MRMPFNLCSYSVYFLSQNVVSKTEEECYKIKQTKTTPKLMPIPNKIPMPAPSKEL